MGNRTSEDTAEGIDGGNIQEWAKRGDRTCFFCLPCWSASKVVCGKCSSRDVGVRVGVEVSLCGSLPPVGTRQVRRADEVRKYTAIKFPTECGTSNSCLIFFEVSEKVRYMHGRDAHELKR